MSETTPSTSAPIDEDVVEGELIAPSEEIDAELEQQARIDELLADLPSLIEPHRFRIAHRHAFDDLVLEAQKSGAFERDNMDYDWTVPEDIEDYQKLAKFIASIDTWAESIARDKDAYVSWSEGKREEHFLALFEKYKKALGESNGSGS